MTVKPVSKEHLEFLMDIRNNIEVKPFLRQVEFCSMEGQLKWYDNLINNSSTYAFAITDNDIVIGSCSIIGIDQVYGNAEVGWFLTPNHHGKGYCSAAVQYMFDFAFNHLQLNSLFAYVYSDNVKGLKFAEKMMKKVGVLRNRRWRGTVLVDEVVFDLTRKDYYGN
jgi:RimJ/RimL family protein N-acetyltransferase